MSLKLLFLAVAILALVFAADHQAAAFSPVLPNAVLMQATAARTTDTIGNNLHSLGSSIDQLQDGGVIPQEIASASSSLWVSVQTGAINWSNPAEAIGGGITLIYIVFSLWAGAKYILKDGWRPKL